MTVANKVRQFIGQLACQHLYAKDWPVPVMYEGERDEVGFRLVSPKTKTCLQCKKVTKG
jgi:hypothetical protein